MITLFLYQHHLKALKLKPWLGQVVIGLMLMSTLPAFAVTKFVAVGDSITLGIGVINPDSLVGDGCVLCGGYEYRLDILLDNNGLPSTVYNYGVSGESSSAGAARIPEVIAAVNPEYVLFM